MRKMFTKMVSTQTEIGTIAQEAEATAGEYL